MKSYIYNSSLIPQDYGFIGVEHPVTPQRYLVKGPKQTNRWWQNLVLGQGSAIVALYPYLIAMTGPGFQLSYPTLVATETYIVSPFVANWDVSLGKKPLAKTVVGDDDLSCTLKMENVATMPLVRGSPYLTMELNDARPAFKTAHSILEKTQKNPYQTLVRLNNNQAWMFFSSAPARWNARWNHSQSDIYLDSSYTGTIRMALVKEPIDQNMDILESHSKAYPVSGKVTYEFPSSDKASIRFDFKARGTGDLLMFTLPHHQDILVNPQRVNLTGYSTIKGPLSAIKGLGWTIKENLTNITWSSPNRINPQLLPKIKEAVQREAIFIDPIIRGTYTFGKAIAALARMGLIAEEVEELSTAERILAEIRAEIEPWLRGGNEDALVYDQTWGGLVSGDGLSDPGADFGNGRYSDHHFHYGYFLYAAAIIGKSDPTWLAKWKDPLILLVRDFANPNPNDRYFPRFRHKDFYDGHSWASGIFDFNDNRNQESTSESVNAYYAMYLLAIALNDQPMANLANLLLMTEIRSAQAYWHMYSGHSVYPEVFAKQKTVGIMWGTKVDYATWFGSNVEYIHAIQLLPFTPISHLLLEQPWMQEAYPVLATSLNRTDPPLLGGWQTYVHMAHAIIQPSAAYAEFENSPREMDEGNSLTSTLYWFATQPQ